MDQALVLAEKGLQAAESKEDSSMECTYLLMCANIATQKVSLC